MMNRPGMNRPGDFDYNWQERNLQEVSGIFNNQNKLENLLDELARRGIRDDVSVLMTDQTRDDFGGAWPEGQLPEPRIEHATKLPEGAATGGLTGGILGAVIGGLTMVGSVLIPGAGLLVAGPLIGALTGGAIGTAAGGLVGALVGAGIPEEEAKFYEKQLKERGNVLVVAHTPQAETDAVRHLFKKAGAQSIRVS